MKILTVANEKGGVGKTFFSTQFAFYCALKFGLRVALIDLDQQANASRCLAIKDYAVKADVKSADLLLGTADIKHYTDKLVYFEADDRLSMLEKQGDTMHGVFVENLLKALKQLESSFDLVIIDTNPNPDIRSNAGLLVCTHLVSPIQLTKEPIDGISRLFDRLSGISTLNSNLPEGIIGMLPNQVEAGAFQVQNGQMLIEAYGKLLIPVTEYKPQCYKDVSGKIGAMKDDSGNFLLTEIKSFAAVKRRAVVAEAQALGSPLWEMPNTQSWNEIKRVFFTVLERLKIDRSNEATADMLALLDECRNIYGAKSWKRMVRQFWLTDNSTIMLGLTPDKINQLRKLRAYVPLSVIAE